MDIVICKRCEGTGNVEFDVGTHKSEYEQEECGECKGSGRVRQTTIEKIVPYDTDKKEYTRIF